MLEGYPFRRWNDMKLDGLLRSIAGERPSVPVHLVPPVRDMPEGDVPAGAFGPVELLPAVTCVGSFTSYPVDPERDSVLHHSTLTVVWFQASPAVPSGEDADQGLRGVRWDEVARDVER